VNFSTTWRIGACALSVVFACGLAVPAAVSAPSAQKVQAVTTLDSQIFKAINKVRHDHHLQALTRSSDLDKSAADQSKSMLTKGFFAHESADGTAFWKRIKRYYTDKGYKYWEVGENLLWSSPSLTSKSAIKIWMDSPPHRANILDKSWRDIGISSMHSDCAPGTFQNQPTTVVTVDFGVRR